MMTTLIINSIHTPNQFLPERTSKNKTVLSERGDYYITAADNTHCKIINMFSQTTFKVINIIGGRNV